MLIFSSFEQFFIISWKENVTQEDQEEDGSIACCLSMERANKLNSCLEIIKFPIKQCCHCANSSSKNRDHYISSPKTKFGLLRKRI
jgi:hypothetical protein